MNPITVTVSGPHLHPDRLVGLIGLKEAEKLGLQELNQSLQRQLEDERAKVACLEEEVVSLRKSGAVPCEPCVVSPCEAALKGIEELHD